MRQVLGLPTVGGLFSHTGHRYAARSLISAPSSATCSETRNRGVQDRYDLDLVAKVGVVDRRALMMGLGPRVAIIMAHMHS